MCTILEVLSECSMSCGYVVLIVENVCLYYLMLRLGEWLFCSMICVVSRSMVLL